VAKGDKKLGCCSIVVLGFACLCLISLFLPRDRAARPPQAESSPTPAASPAASGPTILPEVLSFLTAHPEFGRPTRVQDVPDWAKGRRQRADTDRGKSLLIYLKGDRVITVFDWPQGGERKLVWGDTEH
jgi:hypothetical protein